MVAEVTIALISGIVAIVLALIGYRVERIRKQVTANSGSSLFDAVNRIEIQQANFKEDMTEIKGDVRAIRKNQSTQGERIARLEARSNR